MELFFRTKQRQNRCLELRLVSLNVAFRVKEFYSVFQKHFRRVIQKQAR